MKKERESNIRNKINKLLQPDERPKERYEQFNLYTNAQMVHEFFEWHGKNTDNKGETKNWDGTWKTDYKLTGKIWKAFQIMLTKELLPQK